MTLESMADEDLELVSGGILDEGRDSPEYDPMMCPVPYLFDGPDPMAGMALWSAFDGLFYDNGQMCFPVADGFFNFVTNPGPAFSTNTPRA